MILRFGTFEIDTAASELRGPNGPVPIEPKVFDLLLYFAENPGRTLSRDELIDHVWSGRVVSDAAVATVLKLVRRAIGDDGIHQHLLKTIHSRGYRFTAEVEILRPADAAPPDPPSETKALGGQATIAILPFQAFSPEPALVMLADAIPAEIISALSRLRWLRVLARESSFRFRSSSVDPASLRSVLCAGYALSGVIETTGGNLALGVELSDTVSGAILWADRVAGRIDDLHALRHQIVEAVIAALDLQIPLNEAARARLMTTDDLDAWGAYHLGMAHAFRWTRRDNEIAAGLFTRAVSLDPNFAAAHAGLSFTSFQDAFSGFVSDRASAVRAARAAAERSVELDPLDPQANSAMGRLGLLEGIDTDWDTWMARSVALSPSYAKGHYSRALMQVCAGLAIDARGGLELAEKLSPLDPLMGPMLGMHGVTYAMEGDLDRAADLCRHGTTVARNHMVLHVAAAAIHQMAGQKEEARRMAQMVQSRRPDMTIGMFQRAIPFTDPNFRQSLRRALIELGFPE